MSLLLDTDVELSTDPPLHPLAPDSAIGGYDSAFNAFGVDPRVADRLADKSGPPSSLIKLPLPDLDSSIEEDKVTVAENIHFNAHKSQRNM